MTGIRTKAMLILFCWSMLVSTALAQASSPFFIWVKEVAYEPSTRQYQVEVVHSADDETTSLQASLTTVPAGVSMMDKTIQIDETLAFNAAALRDGQVYAIEVYALDEDGKRIQNDANRDVMAIYQFVHRVPIIEIAPTAIPVAAEEPPSECNLRCQLQGMNMTTANLVIGGLGLLGIAAIASSIMLRRRQSGRRKNVTNAPHTKQKSGASHNQTTQIDMLEWEDDLAQSTRIGVEQAAVANHATELDAEFEESLTNTTAYDDGLYAIEEQEVDLDSLPYAEIRVIKSPDAKKEGGFYQVYEFPYVLGRDKGHLTIFDKRISSTHAQITFVGGRYFLTDLGSSNGIYINGKRIEQNSEIILPMSEETKISLASSTHLSFTGYSIHA